MFKINNKDTRITSIDVTRFFSYVSNTFSAKISILNYCIFLLFLTFGISTHVSLEISCYPGDEVANWLK